MLKRPIWRDVTLRAIVRNEIVLKTNIKNARSCTVMAILFAWFVFYLLTQAGFSGSYTADVDLRPTAGFLESYRVLIYRPTRGWTAELAVSLW